MFLPGMRVRHEGERSIRLEVFRQALRKRLRAEGELKMMPKRSHSDRGDVIGLCQAGASLFCTGQVQVELVALKAPARWKGWASSR